MRARKVKGLDPAGPLRENALRIARVRIDELWSFAEAVHDPADEKSLHDMRIAAKRVRYLLELMEPCLGPAARRGAGQAKAIQSLLGEIHDCDEMLPRVRDHSERLRAEDAAFVRGAAGERARDVEPASVRAAPNRTRHRGLESLHAYLRARREVLYARFIREWTELEEGGFRPELERDLEAAARGARPRRAH